MSSPKETKSPERAKRTSHTSSPKSVGSPENAAQLQPTEFYPTNTQIPFVRLSLPNPAANSETRADSEILKTWNEDDTDSALGDEDSVISSTASLSESIYNYRNLHGRTYQSSSTTEYWGPNDDTQNMGLDIAHHFITMLLDDRLFLAPLPRTLSKVLDVGTGTGIWAIDMADTFPSAEIIGTDISPIQPLWVPQNCAFQIEDAQLEWTYSPATFDYVHIRALYGSIGDWVQLYNQAYQAIVPGGWIEDFEFTITLHSDLPEVRDDPDHIFKRWSTVFLEAGDRLGRTFRIAMNGRMERYMRQAGFVNVVQKDYQVPVGGWSSHPKYRNIGLYNLTFMEESLEGFALFMLREIMGWEYTRVQVFLAEMRSALRNARIRPYYIVTNVYAQKPITASIDTF